MGKTITSYCDFCGRDTEDLVPINLDGREEEVCSLKCLDSAFTNMRSGLIKEKLWSET